MERFGERFEPKHDDRLDVLNTRSKPIPEYVERAREIRGMLSESARGDEGWGTPPETADSIEEFVESSKELVTERWKKEVTPLLTEKCTEWADALHEKPEYSELEELLRDPDLLERKLMIRQFGVLEPLRTVLPDAWRELVHLSSERQLASVAVARHWAKDLTPEEGEKLSEAMGLKSTAELELLLDTAAFLGKYIDYAYVKQIELADSPGGSTESPRGKESAGIQYLYDVYTSPESDAVDVKPYVDVFPKEYKGIVQSLERLALKTEKLMESEAVGSEYQELPAYLRSLADVYGSKNIDPDELYRTWQEAQQKMRQLVESGCPVMLVAQATPSVAGDAHKVDVEMRLGFRTKESQELESTLNEFRSITQELMDAEVPSMEGSYPAPAVIVNYQPYAFGPNIYWTARGERGKDKIVAHTNAVIDVAVTTAYPELTKMFSNPVEEEDFKRAAVLDNSIHELGHMVLFNEDPKVRARVGTSTEAGVLEELKADTMDQKVLLEYSKRLGDAFNLENQFMGKLGDICDYLKNKSTEVGTSGEQYFTAGVAMIDRLLEKGMVVADGERYRVVNAELAVQELAALGDEILELYRSGTPEAVQTYARGLREKAKNERVAPFIEKLKSK